MKNSALLPATYAPRRLRILLLLAAAGCIIPVLWLSFYAQPAVDDFSLSELCRSRGYYGALQFYYNNAGGRYTAYSIAAVNPLNWHRIDLYGRVIFVFNALYFGMLGLLVRSAFRKWLGQKDRRAVWALIVVTLSCCTGSGAQHHFWLSGITTYLLCVILLSAWLCVLFSLPRAGLPRALSAGSGAVLLLLIAGCCEIGMALAGLCCVLFLLHAWRLQPNNRAVAIVWIVALGTGSYFALTAPGNYERMTSTPHSGNLLLAIAVGIYASLKFLPGWLLFILPAAVLFVSTWSTALPNISGLWRLKNSRKKFVAVLLVMPGLFLGLQCALVFACGALPEARTENLVVLAVLPAVCGLWLWAQPPFYPSLRRMDAGGTPIAAFALIMLLVCGATRATVPADAWMDLLSGAARRYQQAEQKRYQIIAASADSVVRVPAIPSAPASLYPLPTLDTVATPPRHSFVQRCYAKYWGKSWVYPAGSTVVTPAAENLKHALKGEAAAQ